MASKLVITNAGLDKMVRSDNTGTAAVVISTCRFGSSKWSPTPAATALQSPLDISPLTAKGAVTSAGNQIHITVIDESSASYSAYEAGLFDSDGTLIAIASQTTPIITKASTSTAMLTFDIALENLDTDNITFGGIGVINPQATETVQGVAEIATADEVAAGTDDTRIVTPKKLVDWVMSALSPYLPKSQLLDKTWPVGSVYMSVNSTSPATLFGGTWERITDCFLYAGFGSGDYGLGKTGGSKTATISVANMPSHAHGGSTAGAGSHTPSGTISGGSHAHSGTTASNGKHTHTRGTMDIKGSFSSEALMSGGSTGAPDPTGAFSLASTSAKHITASVGGTGHKINFTASNNWTGSTSEVSAHTHTITTGSATPSMKFSGTSVGNHTHGITAQGGGEAFSIMPPFLAVYAWKRTA